MGGWIQGTAISWLIYRLTGSAFLLGLVNFAAFVPAILLAPVSGIVTDRFKRKNVLIFTQTIFIIQSSVFALLFYTKVINVWQIILLSLVFGIVNSFDEPARESFVPLLVKKENLFSAISFSSIIGNLSNVFGPAIGGFLIASKGEGFCFITNALLHIPIVLFLIWVRPREQEIKNVISPVKHLKEGFLYAINNKPVFFLLIFVGLFCLFGTPFGTLFPIYSKDILHAGPQGMGILLGVSGIGAVLGALYLASRKNVIDVKKNIALCGLIFGLCMLFFAYSKNFIFSNLLLIPVGFAYTIVSSGSNAALQAMADDYLRGRIIGLYSAMIMGMFPLGSLFLGYFADKTNPQLAVFSCGILCVLASVWFMLKMPRLIKEAKELIKL